MGRTAYRDKFDTIVKQLPRIKKDRRRPNVQGLLGEIFNENSMFGRSTADNTSDNLRTMSFYSQPVFPPYPEYYYTPRDNLFNSMEQTKEHPLEPKFFKLTQPDDRLAQHLYNTQHSWCKDSLLTGPKTAPQDTYRSQDPELDEEQPPNIFIQNS